MKSWKDPVSRFKDKPAFSPIECSTTGPNPAPHPEPMVTTNDYHVYREGGTLMRPQQVSPGSDLHIYREGGTLMRPQQVSPGSDLHIYQEGGTLMRPQQVSPPSDFHIYQTGGSLLSTNSSSQLSMGSGAAEGSVPQVAFEPGDANSASDCSQNSVTSVSAREIDQIRLFFSGNKTQVYVCPVMANMYQKQTGAINASATTSSTSATPDGWHLRYTGVPVLLRDAGCTRTRTRPQLQLVLAERGTGFLLWRHVLEPGCSPLEAPEPGFYTLQDGVPRRDATTRHVFGLSFDGGDEAMTFMTHVKAVMQEMADSAAQPKKSKRCSRSKSLTIRKRDISMPCCFTHVCSVDSNNRLASMQSLVARK